jgi:hypothetical protein
MASGTRTDRAPVDLRAEEEDDKQDDDDDNDDPDSDQDEETRAAELRGGFLTEHAAKGKVSGGKPSDWRASIAEALFRVWVL